MPNDKKEFAYVQAQPGFNIVERAGERACLTPIIAWEIVRNPNGIDGAVTMVFPITVEGVNQTDPIQYPDGRVATMMGAEYESVGEWLKEMLDVAEKTGHDS